MIDRARSGKLSRAAGVGFRGGQIAHPRSWGETLLAPPRPRSPGAGERAGFRGAAERPCPAPAAVRPCSAPPAPQHPPSRGSGSRGCPSSLLSFSHFQFLSSPYRVERIIPHHRVERTRFTPPLDNVQLWVVFFLIIMFHSTKVTVNLKLHVHTHSK